MGTIAVLRTATVESSLPELNYRKAGCQPVNLLAFLQAENLKLRTQVAELQRDTTALQEAWKKIDRATVAGYRP
jgi:chromosome segregation ATPase